MLAGVPNIAREIGALRGLCLQGYFMGRKPAAVTASGIFDLYVKNTASGDSGNETAAFAGLAFENGEKGIFVSPMGVLEPSTAGQTCGFRGY